MEARAASCFRGVLWLPQRGSCLAVSDGARWRVSCRKAKATAEATRATLAGAETARRVAPYVQGMQGTVSQVREALGRNVGGRRNGAGVDMGVEADAAGA